VSILACIAQNGGRVSLAANRAVGTSVDAATGAAIPPLGAATYVAGIPPILYTFCAADGRLDGAAL